MKLTNCFDHFMRNTVNMDEGRLRSLKTSVDAIYSTLANDDELGELVEGMDPQGSWAQETIIKPVDGREFDADFMLVMTHQPGWKPSAYLTAVYEALRRSPTYKDKVQKKHRCVRVVYAADYHVDIVPFVVLPDGSEVIAHHEMTEDGEIDEWEDTDPTAFTAWMQRQDGVANGNLRRTIRLMKYLRDHHMNFKLTRSVILTVVLGERVSARRKLDEPDCYSDLPTAFVHILEDLDDWMDSRPNLPPLPDPSGANNDFSHRWSQESYENLAAKVKTIAADARAAIDPDLSVEHSLKAWQKVFGSDFKRPPDVGPKPGAGAASPLVIPSRQSGRDG
ncbi:MAG: hypothetical protein JWN67_1145 [Actinomycetia bacterium]|nr:hypothetical protein [Actinomycetes bacterium]